MYGKFCQAVGIGEEVEVVRNESGRLRGGIEEMFRKRDQLHSSGDLGGREIYVVIYSIGTGGRTAAILDQCEVFAELGMDPVIVTFDFQRDFTTSVKSSLNGRPLPPRTTVINIYEDLCRRDATAVSSSDCNPLGESDIGCTSASHEVGAREHCTSFDQRGQCVRVRQKRSGTVERDVMYRDGVPYLARDYDVSGLCVRESSLAGAEDAVSEERYYAIDGWCYLTRMLDPESKKQRGNFWHVRGGTRSRRYGHNTPFHSAWLEDIVRRRTGEGRTRPLVIGESPSGVLKVLDIDASVADRLYMFHENHLAAPHVLGAPIRSDYGTAPKRIKEMPLLVVPTESQAQDIRAQFGDDVRVRAIGNLVVDKRSGAPIEKVAGRIGSFGRLAPSKQIDRTIRAFMAVHERVPDARLEIFGDGPERGGLEALAKRLGVCEAVTFHGRVSGVGDEMARSVVVVSTTSTESFGLSIAESLAAGTPVVSYDVNYGPGDLIQDGRDGYLVEPEDDEGLADRLVDLLEDQALAGRFGRHAEQRMAADFTRVAFMDAWRSALLEAAAVER